MIVIFNNLQQYSAHLASGGCITYKKVIFLFTSQQARVHLLDTEPFQDAFGPKGKRKRPKLLACDYDSLVKKADGSQGT